jgi:pimeloyl-ACP methyl ester carboxylesterase
LKEYFLNNEICYHFNEFKPDRLTLIFIHGIPGCLSGWAQYEEKFGKEYNILTYDIRGHGKSKRFKKYEDYNIENFTEDLYKLIEHLKIKNFVLISHSFGVFISLSFVSKYKDEVKGLILLSPSFIGKEIPSIKKYETLLNIVSKIKLPIFSNKKRKYIEYPTSIHGMNRYKIAIKEIYNTGLQVYLYCIRQLVSLDFEKMLSEITLPVLLISGEKDTTIPIKYAKIMAEKIPNSKIVTIKEGNHIITLNNFKEVSTEIENFIQKIK